MTNTDRLCAYLRRLADLAERGRYDSAAHSFRVERGAQLQRRPFPWVDSPAVSAPVVDNVLRLRKRRA